MKQIKFSQATSEALKVVVITRHHVNLFLDSMRLVLVGWLVGWMVGWLVVYS